MELTDAVANENITEIVFSDDIVAELTGANKITRSLTIDFQGYTLTGHVLFQHDEEGTSVLNGDTGNRILGTLEVDTQNASFENNVGVRDGITITNVEVGTWTERVDGNTIIITDDDGSTIVIEGNPASISINTAGNSTPVITIKTGASVLSITVNAKATINVESGAIVSTLENNATGTNVTGSGSIEAIEGTKELEIDENVKTPEVIAAELAVTNAESAKTQEAVTAAQALVDALPEGEVKGALQARLLPVVVEIYTPEFKAELEENLTLSLKFAGEQLAARQVVNVNGWGNVDSNLKNEKAKDVFKSLVVDIFEDEDSEEPLSTSTLNIGEDAITGGAGCRLQKVI